MTPLETSIVGLSKEVDKACELIDKLRSEKREMLEALSNLVSYLREFWPDEPLFFSESRKAADVIVAAEAVIEKAQGL